MERSKALALYEKVLSGMDGVERKGDTMPYTSLNGHMFSIFRKDGFVALRLPERDRAAVLRNQSDVCCGDEAEADQEERRSRQEDVTQ